MVIKWNLLEGYQGLRELAESSDEVWNTARNQEIAGGLSNRALVRSWEETAGTHRGPGLDASCPSSPLRTTHSSCGGLERTPGCPAWAPCPAPGCSWSRRSENRHSFLHGGGGGTRTAPPPPPPTTTQELEQTEGKPALLPPWRRWGHPHPPNHDYTRGQEGESLWGNEGLLEGRLAAEEPQTHKCSLQVLLLKPRREGGSFSM